MFNEEKTQYILPYLSLVILPLYSVKCFIAETFNVLKVYIWFMCLFPSKIQMKTRQKFDAGF